MLPESHKTFLTRALPVIQADPRILGAVRENTDDPFTALSLVLVSAVPLDAELRNIAEQLGKCLVGFPDEKHDRLICLYEDPLVRVELGISPLSDFTGGLEVIWEKEEGLLPRRGPNVSFLPDLQWMEDRIWVWIHDGALSLARGEIFPVIDMLNHMRSRILAPLLALKTNGHSRPLPSLEASAGENLAPLRATVAQYDPRSCELSLLETAKLYLDLRETLAPPALRRHRRAEMVTMRFLHQVSERIHAPRMESIHLV